MQNSLMTLSSVARLACVKRPVVSSWRKRYAGSDYPFPPPTSTNEAGQSLFEVDKVVQWLSRTGRGNNPETALDAAAYSLDIEQHFEEVTILLTLRAAHGQSLLELDNDDLMELAEELDPNNESLLAEVSRGIPDHLHRLTEELVEAAFTVSQAFEHLLSQRRRTSPATDLFADNLHPRAARLVGGLAAGLGGSRDANHILDATAAGSDLLIETIRQLPEGWDIFADLAQQADMPGNAAARLAMRRVMVHRLTRAELISATRAPGATIMVAHWPGPGDPDSAPTHGIRFLNEVALNLDHDDVALVVGPPRVLLDEIGDETDSERADLLRTGSVRGVIALPAGLVPSRPRQKLGLWVLASAQSAVPPRERRMYIADLSEKELDEILEGLLTDIAALLEDPQTRHARAFRYGRILPIYRVLADGRALTALVDTTPQPLRPRDAANTIVASQQSVENLSQHIAELMPPNLRIAPCAVEASDSQRSAAVWTSLQSLVDARRLALLPGHRFDPADLGTAESQEQERHGIPVVTADSVLQRSAPRMRIAALKLAQYPNAELTEPGDVVFTTNPPSAWVDREGSSVVLAPVRTLRPRDPGVLAEVLRSDITAERARNWKTWQVRRFASVPHGLETGLEQIRQLEVQLEQITAQTNTLKNLLTDAASLGVAEINTSQDPED